jgi:hypothetical protein
MDPTGKATFGPRLEEGMTTLTDNKLARDIHPGLTVSRIPMASPEEDGHGAYSTNIPDLKPSADDWNRLRAEFTFYYTAYNNNKGLPLRVVSAILACEHGFIAS